MPGELKVMPSYVHAYTERDVILYALGIGASVTEDPASIYESHPNFKPFPTFAIIAAQPGQASLPSAELIPNVNPMSGLHAEQYLELRGPIPSSGSLVSEVSIVDVIDKGQKRGALAVCRAVTRDAESGREVAVNEMTAFFPKVGGWGGPTERAPRPAAATAHHTPPPRPPDSVRLVPTSPTAAALYRLSGDYNPLHIDPEFAQAFGFERPILHGLCTMGMSVRAVLREMAGGDYGRLASVKVRFSKHVFPGETLSVRMWRLSPTLIIFETFVEERQDAGAAISSAAITLTPASSL